MGPQDAEPVTEERLAEIEGGLDGGEASAWAAVRAALSCARGAEKGSALQRRAADVAGRGVWLLARGTAERDTDLHCQLARAASQWATRLRESGAADVVMLAATSEALPLCAEALRRSGVLPPDAEPRQGLLLPPPPDPGGLPDSLTLATLNLLELRLRSLRSRLEMGNEEGGADWHSLSCEVQGAAAWVEAAAPTAAASALRFYRKELVRSAVQVVVMASSPRQAAAALAVALGHICKGSDWHTVDAAGRRCFRRAFEAWGAWTKRVHASIQSAVTSEADGAEDTQQPRPTFGELAAVSTDHFCAPAAAVRANPAADEVWLWYSTALVLWDAVQAAAGDISGSLHFIRHVARAALYQGDEGLHLWSLLLLQRAGGPSGAAFPTPLPLQIARLLLQRGHCRGAIGAAELAAAGNADAEWGVQRIVDVGCRAVRAAAGAALRSDDDDARDALFAALADAEAETVCAEEPHCILRQEVLWAVRTAAAECALATCATEAVLACTAGTVIGCFRTDHLYPDAYKQNSLISVHNIFTMLQVYCDALMVRGEFDKLERTLSQAIKMQASTPVTFSAVHTARVTLLRARQLLLQGNAQDCVRLCLAAADVVAVAPRSTCSAELRVHCLLQRAQALRSLGDLTGASAAVEEAEAVLPALQAAVCLQTLQQPWAPLLGHDALQQLPVPVDPSDQSDRAAAAAARACSLLRSEIVAARGSAPPSEARAARRAALSVAESPDPVERVRARVALAELQQVARPRQSHSARGGHKAGTEVKQLSEALATGARWRGPVMQTRRVSMELARRLCGKAEIGSVVGGAAGSTAWHQLIGSQLRRQGRCYGRMQPSDADTHGVTAEVLRLLPETVAVVTLSESLNGSLYVTRAAAGAAPAAVELRESGGPLRSCIDDLRELLRAAKAHLKEVERCPRRETADFKAEWWAMRTSFDERMQDTVATISDGVLGHWRGLLLGRPLQRDTRDAIARVASAAGRRIKAATGVHADPALLQLLVGSAPHLHEGVPETAVRCEHGYWAQTSDMLRRGMAELVGVDSPELAAVAEAAHRQMAEVLVPGDGGHCRRQHVLLVLSGDLHALPWETAVLRGQQASRIPSVQWLLSQLPKLSAEHPRTVLRDGLDARRVGYMLNPDGNLLQSERHFAWFSAREGWSGMVGPLAGTVVGGPGLGSGCPDDPAKARRWRLQWVRAWQQGLRLRDVLVYIGHGTGEQFVTLDDVRCAGHLSKAEEETLVSTAASGPMRSNLFAGPADAVRCSVPGDAAVCILTGCSGGLLTAPGDRASVDAQGMASACLLAGSPAVVANLWDVTDGEIDRFTRRLLRLVVGGEDGEPEPSTGSWALSGAPQHATGSLRPWTLADAVNDARAAPRLRYFTGACPVLYGLPVCLRADGP